MIYIAACCKNCADAIARTEKVERYASIHGVEQLRGLRGVELLVCTNWSSRKDYGNLREEIAARQITFRMVIHKGYSDAEAQARADKAFWKFLHG